jgi:hypothetical protein
MPFKSRYGAHRHLANRQVLPVITVVCDDTKTAVAYFGILKHEVKTRRTVLVFPAPHCGADAGTVFAFAKAKRPQTSEPNDKVFVIIDMDTNPNIDALRNKGVSDQILVLASLPCYEIWTLAHLEDTGEAFQDCRAVLERIRQRWKERFGHEFGSKAQADYAKLMSLRSDALERCRQRSLSNNQSWTEVWKAVEAIIE